ncbi:hypothetical protein IR145_04995 [Streptococcus danieliae]|uniref:Uncharacterized protein n=1 Tax=Streptococcus acidominimus TaxID=1326 RepID=A0A4Y9FPV2_STRAI|nr:hypothetical protein [Streptococcus acidominimus]MBF0846821.1 hypothetical protein [Streptococcus danieliae]TFU30298.1 hypothetical protein E4U01_06775 [Streptococcus acidominimus]
MLTVIGTLKIIHRWLDGNLDYYERDFRMGAKKDPLERSSWGNFGAKNFKSIQIYLNSKKNQKIETLIL